MASEEAAQARLAGDVYPKQIWYGRSLGVPPKSIGSQSDASGMAAQQYVMTYLAEAIQTIYFPGRSGSEPMHSMVFICLDDVQKHAKHREGGRLSHSKASEPGMTIVVHDKAMSKQCQSMSSTTPIIFSRHEQTMARFPGLLPSTDLLG